MPASKFSKEFKEQIIAEVLEGSRPIAEVAKSYNLVPQTVGNWVRIWRKQHPDPGMVEASSDQVAEHQTLAGRGWVKRRWRSSSEIKRRPSSRRNPGSSEICLYSPRGRQLSCVFDVPLGQSVSFWLLQVAESGFIRDAETPGRTHYFNYAFLPRV